MPEGDTLHRLATRVRGSVGRTVTGFRLRDRGEIPSMVGRVVRTSEAFGKHLLVGFSGGVALHVHLGMYGRWHAYAPGERWHRSSASADVVLETDGLTHACWRASTAELVRSQAIRTHPRLSRLGPDLLGKALDLDRVLERARQRHGQAIAELLLDQTVACGIGNVYKSELLFLAGVHPTRPAGEVPDDTLRAIYADARRLMQANLTGGRRRTVPRDHGPRLWVYGRARRPCLRCRARIEVALQGDLARVTYWCPSCQPGG